MSSIGLKFIQSGYGVNKSIAGYSTVIGPTGPQGYQGEVGPQGFQGSSGIIGSTGPQGFQGSNGPIGSTGPQGFQGANGIIGSTGPQGFQGNNSLWNTSGSSIYFSSGPVGIGKSSSLTGALDIIGNVNIVGTLSNPTFQSYKETIFIRSYSGAFTLDCATGNNFAITLSSGTNSVSFANFSPTGTLQGVNLFVSQDSIGNRLLSYPATVSWGSVGAPTLSTSANNTDVISFITYTGGSKILAFLSGKGF